jgi:glycosyltransferase involved in cell wall biosynthesis
MGGPGLSSRLEGHRMSKQAPVPVQGNSLRTSDTEAPKVSILVLTYNHEQYIAKALEGALSQRTNFKFEIVIADDCSRDRTTEIVTAISRKYKSRVRVLPRPRNLGLCKNFIDAYKACRGDYTAILEGDDIWHNPNKLQRLADVLDKRKECSFVFHNVKLLFEDGREQASCCPPSLKPELGLLDFIAENFVPSCSAIMFRHRLVRQFPDWFRKLSYYDWPLHILHLQQGPAVYLRDILSTYRIHGASAWHGASRFYQVEKLLEIFREVNRHLKFRYDSILRLNGRYWELQLENERLYHSLQESERLRREAESQRADLLGSRSYKLVRVLAGMKGFTKRLCLPRKRLEKIQAVG